MITKENFIDLLKYLGYKTLDNNIYKYEFSQHGCGIEINFSEEKIKYPKEKGFVVNENQTCNFSSAENFVVFECVHRLLEKGYKPAHIELERRWSLGHSQKSGRADICVMNETGSSILFIIECKTYLEEYEKALKILKEDGGQLFSYYQQDKSVNWISLYTSNFEENKIVFKESTIATFDTEDMLQKAKKNRDIQIYEKAKTKEQSFEVWKKTYQEDIRENVLFSDDTVAYIIGEKPLRKRDLKEFNTDDKIVNQFEEILRHNNVSDKENAFNKIVALFICKLVDEINKDDNDIVEFQYKVGTDTYETLQERLQRLHKEGMEKFLKEDVFYVSSEYPTLLFSEYNGGKRKNAIHNLRETFRKLKFYSNNEFAFKDVHNEVLFQQNGKILVEVIKLFEKYRIVYGAKHQFLGDLFEQLLNKGFKQNEGQFFTPTPITRFIWESLPVEQIVNTNNGKHYPKVIDYACGSGHFLTEGIELINRIMNNSNNDWVSENIYGIEKDYRLARVSKISLFMNGAGGGNIIFGDGLDNDPSKGIENGEFDILVANPPYSVKAFKSHLKLENNYFELLDRISNEGGEIEVLFIERIVQLVKPNGIAAVILPSSILTNNSNSYIGARELLLKNFEIKAIVQFGSKTFGATGTNTVVLYLKKYNEPPKKHEIIEDSIRNIFSGDMEKEWGDEVIFDDYVEYIGVDKELYKEFIRANIDYKEFMKNDYFKMYVDDFENLSEIKNRKKQSTFLKLSKEEQQEDLKKKFYAYVREIEEDKMFYYGMVKDGKTLVVNAPTNNTEQKEFLGYDWSNRKGNEGIQITKLGGMLFDENDRNAQENIAFYIRKSFMGEVIPKLGACASYINNNRLVEMIDFKDSILKKEITLKKKHELNVVSQYPVVKLMEFNNGNIFIKKGTSIVKEQTNQEGKIKVVAGGKEFAYYHDKANREKNVITISASGAYAGYVNFYEEEIFASDCTTVQTDNSVLTKYVYYYLKSLQEDIYQLQKGSGQPHVYPKDIEKIPIPQLPLNIVNEIVKNCEKIEKKYEQTRMKIEEYQKQIKDIFESLEVVKNPGGGYKLNDKKTFQLSIGKRILNSELTEKGIPVYSANVFEPFGMIDKYLIQDFSKVSILWGIDGDWMVNILPKGYEFYPTDHCGVLRVDESIIHPRYVAYVLQKEGERIGFSRNFRASLDRVKDVTFVAPSLEVQNKAMKQVEELEQKIKMLNKNQLNLTDEISKIVTTYI